MTGPHPLDPDSKLNPEERALLEAIIDCDAEWAVARYEWSIASYASSLVTTLHSLGKHVCLVGPTCLNDPLPDQAHARSGDPKVSHVAADSIGNMAERHRAVLQIAQTFADTFTYEELEYRYNKRREEGYQHGKKSSTFVLDLPPMKGSSVRSRAAELRRAGWLEQAGRGLSDAGRPCNTWRVIR